MLKRVAILLFCLLITFVATFGFVVGVVAVPTIYSYASVNDDPIYVNLRERSDLVDCFQAYCKSRDLTIEGSLTDAVTTFTTGAFNSACNEIGINITQLQAEIKAEYDQSGKPVKFFMNETGVMAMNRIFAQFLQDNELEVGDQNVNDTVFDGDFYSDDDNSGLIYIFNSAIAENGDLFNADENLIQKGSAFMYTNQYLYDSGQSSYTMPFKTTSNTYDIRVGRYLSGSRHYMSMNFTNSAPSKYSHIVQPTTDNGDDIFTGNLIIYKRDGSNLYHLGSLFNAYNKDYTSLLNLGTINFTNEQTPQNTTIVIISNTINNNNYEGDTYITNEGDVINNPTPVPPGGSDPGWDVGGGDGTATDGNGNEWNIHFPDFELPDLNIDWSINGLGEKFPFSIPFDLVALVTVLNAQPQAPRFEGTVNFGFTTWNYDINLQQFDSVAQACRIAELLLLVFGLILITRSIIKG